MRETDKQTGIGGVMAGIMGGISTAGGALAFSWGGAAIAVGAFLVNALLSKSAKGARKPPALQSVYSIDVSETQCDPRVTIPIIYGQMKTHGNYFHLTNGKPFNNSTVVEGAVGFCEGEISEINNIKINNLEYENINADIKTLNTYTGQKQQTADNIFKDFSKSYNEGTKLAENASANFTTNASITDVKLGLLWSDGIYRTTSGGYHAEAVYFDVLYRPSGASVWYDCFENSGGAKFGNIESVGRIISPNSSVVYTIEENPYYHNHGMQGYPTYYPYADVDNPTDFPKKGYMLKVQTRTNMYLPGKSGYYKTWHSVKWGYSSGTMYDMFDVTGNMVSNPTTYDMPFIVHQASGAASAGVIGSMNSSLVRRCAPIYVKIINSGSTDISVESIALDTNEQNIGAFTVSPLRCQYNVFSDCKRQKYDVKVINRCKTPLTVENWQEAAPTALSFPYTAYAAFRFSANQQLQGKIPDISAVIKGKTVNVYSVGSVGSYTNTYSNNPVWCLADFLLSDRYGCGQYFDETDLDLESFYSAASIASTDGRTLNYIIDSTQSAYQVLDAICKVGRLYIYESGGKLYCGNDIAVSSTIQMFDMDTIGVGGFQMSVQAQNTSYNRLNVQFFNEDKDYDRETVVIDDDANINSTGGVRPQTINAYGITSRLDAEKYGRYLLNYQNLGYVQTQINVDYGAVNLEVGDVYEIKHPVPGWGYTQSGGLSVLTGSAGEMFRAIKINENADGNMSITGISYSASMYDESDIATSSPMQSTVPQLFNSTAKSVGVRLTSEFITNKNGQVQGNIIVNWQCDTAQYAIIDHYNIYQSKDNVDYVQVGNTKKTFFRHLAQEDDTEYYYKVCPVTVYGKEQPIKDAVKNHMWHKREFTDNNSIDYLYMQIQGDSILYEYEDVHTGNKDFDYYEMRICDTNIASGDAWDRGQVYKTNIKDSKLITPITAIGSHFLTMKARYKDSSWSDTPYVHNYNIASTDLTTKKMHDSFTDWASSYNNRSVNASAVPPTRTSGTNDFLGWTGSNCVRLPDKDGGYLVMEHAFAASACTFAASSAEAQGITNVTPNINFNHAPNTYKLKYRTFWNLERDYARLELALGDRVASGFLGSSQMSIFTKETFDIEQTDPNLALLGLASNYNFSSLINQTINFVDIGGCTIKKTFYKTSEELSYDNITWIADNTPDAEHTDVKAFVIDYEVSIPSPFQNIYIKQIQQDVALRKRFINKDDITNGVGQWSYSNWLKSFYDIETTGVTATSKDAAVTARCDKSLSAFNVNTISNATGSIVASIDFSYTVEGY